MNFAFPTLITFVIYVLSPKYGQSPVDAQAMVNKATRKGIVTNSRPVNIFVINDEANEIANASIEAALKTLRDKYQGHLGQVYSVQANGSDPQDSLHRICDAWENAIGKSTGNAPDFVLSTAIAGWTVEASNSFSSALGLPTLSGQFGQEEDLRYWSNLDQEKRSYLVQVMPPADLVPWIIRKLAIYLKITNAAILFDRNFDMSYKYNSLLLNVPTRHVINNIAETVDAMKEQLSGMRDLDVVNYFILGEGKTIDMVLKTAEALNFTGRKYGWFALTMEKDIWPNCNCKNISLLFMKPELRETDDTSSADDSLEAILPSPFLSSAFYYDLTLLGVESMKSAIEREEWPVVPSHIGCDDYNGNNTPSRNFDFLEKLRATSKNMTPTYAAFKWGEKNGEHGVDFRMSINLVYIEKETLTSTESTGSWSAGLDSPLEVINNVIVNSTAVTSYRVVTVIHPPFVMYKEETGEWYGFCIDLLNEIRQTVEFEYDIRPIDDYGEMSENGSWNGMIKELMEKRADIALGTLWVMAEREKVVDFTVPYYDLVGLTIMMLKPKTQTSLFKFLTVLENEVWFCILAAYFFTSFLMWVFDRWSPYSYQNNREKYKDDDEKREFNLKECLWFCMTSLTPQGGGEAPKNLSGRLVAATWWLFGFIIIASYTANLAAFLTVSRLDTPIESLDDLSKQYKIQYAPVKNSAAYIYFERMAHIEARFYEIWKDMSLNDSLSEVERAKLAVWEYPVSDKYTKMFQAMKEANFPATAEEAIRRVLRIDSNNEFAYIEDASTIKYLAMTNCDVMQVGEEFSRKPYAIAVQQGSPLKEQFNNAILILLNKRKLEKLKDKWWKRNPERKDCGKEDEQSDGISIHNIGGVFVVIFVGIAFACLTLAFEYWWYRYRPKAIKASSRQIASTPNGKAGKAVRPIRFNLQPAPTQGFQAARFKSRF
ncbi:ionotropic receptor 25a isoform X1 [Vespa crabro]|uniref:ionotropic receptor 25a isoform X1 n=2 Tax=Vespa crabro TaxID=7445 RepID=UPI001F0026B9|nr:ionotropic receptor 25a isoform X1 [Vespa crabro]XP_046835532.1 ionotropic receptor 25a isoform X1 [Vespa crabro]XP_046835533.1 ionotropic receptor 25a isoform X1 [Vespa crabro]XP_046835534.1 ionotropic receptor 25a isoform X1 [Vespa crabro]XP_046835535.1 ionotropic receptor 25a isoform X1 [Vespa crabro]